MSWETFNEEGFRTLHDVQSFRGVRNPARSQNARFSLAHRLAATFPGAGNGMSAMRVLRFADESASVCLGGAGPQWYRGRPFGDRRSARGCSAVVPERRVPIRPTRQCRGKSLYKTQPACIQVRETV